MWASVSSPRPKTWQPDERMSTGYIAIQRPHLLALRDALGHAFRSLHGAQMTCAERGSVQGPTLRQDRLCCREPHRRVVGHEAGPPRIDQRQTDHRLDILGSAPWPERKLRAWVMNSAVTPLFSHVLPSKTQSIGRDSHACCSPCLSRNEFGVSVREPRYDFILHVKQYGNGLVNRSAHR